MNTDSQGPAPQSTRQGTPDLCLSVFICGLRFLLFAVCSPAEGSGLNPTDSVRRRLRARLGAPGGTARQWRLLLALGVANVVDNYDGALLGLALPQIQAGLAV